MEKQKIYVAEYLKYLNENVDFHIKRRYILKKSVKKLNCKELANLCQVTPATITNLNTDSKFSLIYKIASEIYENYYEYFKYAEETDKEEYPDECIMPKDEYYIILQLTQYYTEEWFSYKN